MKLTIKECIKYAKNKNGKCLSTKYKNMKEKLQWECEHGHKWATSFSTIKYRDHWCPYCSKNARLTLKDCMKLAKIKNGKCLSTKYKNAREKLQWGCENKHEWFAPIYSIKNGSWCPYCAGLVKLTLHDCKNIAQNRNGKCLSTKYKNNQTPMKWECDKQHQWFNRFSHIKNGQWCPICSRGKSQKELFSIINIIFPHYTIKYNFRGFSWLKTKDNGFQELDIYIPELKLAIEYDGIQHFKSVKYFGGDKKFKTQKRLDRLKNIKVKQHSEDIKYFIRFNYKEKITKDLVLEKLPPKIIKKHML